MRLEPGSGRAVDLLTGDVWREDWRPEHARVNNERGVSCVLQDVANKLNLDTFGVKRANEDDGHECGPRVFAVGREGNTIAKRPDYTGREDGRRPTVVLP